VNDQARRNAEIAAKAKAEAEKLRAEAESKAKAEQAKLAAAAAAKAQADAAAKKMAHEEADKADKAKAAEAFKKASDIARILKKQQEDAAAAAAAAAAKAKALQMKEQVALAEQLAKCQNLAKSFPTHALISARPSMRPSMAPSMRPSMGPSMMPGMMPMSMPIRARVIATPAPVVAFTAPANNAHYMHWAPKKIWHQQFAIRFEAKAASDVHVVFMCDKAPRSEKAWEVVIGGWGNTKSVIRSGTQGKELVAEQTKGVVDGNTFQEFSIQVDTYRQRIASYPSYMEMNVMKGNRRVMFLHGLPSLGCKALNVGFAAWDSPVEIRNFGIITGAAFGDV